MIITTRSQKTRRPRALKRVDEPIRFSGTSYNPTDGHRLGIGQYLGSDNIAYDIELSEADIEALIRKWQEYAPHREQLNREFRGARSR